MAAFAFEQAETRRRRRRARKLMLAALLLAPLGAQAQGDRVEAIVLATTIERGDTIEQGDLATQSLAPSVARGALAANAIVGKEATRRLAAGRVVRANDVTEPQMVRRGQAVSLVVAKGNLTIAAAGRALTGGSEGSLVRVQNIGSNAILEGEVVAPGTVRIASLGAATLAANLPH